MRRVVLILALASAGCEVRVSVGPVPAEVERRESFDRRPSQGWRETPGIDVSPLEPWDGPEPGLGPIN